MGGFLAPQARRDEKAGRVIGFDIGQVEPVAGGPAGADQHRPAFRQAD
jgi:hypothetical protein